MKKPCNTLYLAFFFLLITGNANANGKVDSLNNILLLGNTTEQVALEVKLQLLDALKYRGSRSDTLSLECIESARHLNLLLKETQARYARCRYLTTKFTPNAEYLEHMNFVDSVAKQYPNEPETYLQARIAFGKYHWMKQAYEEAIVEFEQGLAYAQEHKLEHRYFYLRVNLALNQSLAKRYFDAIRTSEAGLSDPGAQPAYVHAKLAEMYAKLNDWENYLEQSNLLLKDAEKSNDKQAVFVGYVRKAEAMKELGRTDKAILLIESLLARKDILNEQPVWYTTVYEALIKLHIEKEDWDAGIALVDSLEAREVDKRFSYATLASSIGHCYLKNGQTQKAIEWCSDAKQRALKAGRRKVNYLPSSCQCLADAYQKLGKYKLAYENLALRNEYSNEKKDREKIMDLSRALNQQELKKQEEVLALHQTQKDLIHEARLSRNRMMAIFGGLLALAAFAFSWQLRKRNQKIKEQNSRIQKALDEKELLLKEIHHRVKNNLQVISGLLKWQSSFITDDKTLSVFNEGQNRVESMAIIHQKLYQSDNLTGIDMNDYIHRLSQSLVHSYQIKKEQIDLKTDIENLNLDIDTVIPLGLILNELISNALKHAFPNNRKGQIAIKLFEDSSQNELLLSVRDDGVGMNDAAYKRNKESFGWELVETLGKKLKAKVNVKNGAGMEVELRIKNYKLTG